MSRLDLSEYLSDYRLKVGKTLFVLGLHYEKAPYYVVYSLDVSSATSDDGTVDFNVISRNTKMGKAVMHGTADTFQAALRKFILAVKSLVVVVQNPRVKVDMVPVKNTDFLEKSNSKPLAALYFEYKYFTVYKNCKELEEFYLVEEGVYCDSKKGAWGKKSSVPDHLGCYCRTEEQAFQTLILMLEEYLEELLELPELDPSLMLKKEALLPNYVDTTEFEHVFLMLDPGSLEDSQRIPAKQIVLAHWDRVGNIGKQQFETIHVRGVNLQGQYVDSWDLRATGIVDTTKIPPALQLMCINTVFTSFKPNMYYHKEFVHIFNEVMALCKIPLNRRYQHWHNFIILFTHSLDSNALDGAVVQRAKENVIIQNLNLFSRLCEITAEAFKYDANQDFLNEVYFMLDFQEDPMPLVMKHYYKFYEYAFLKVPEIADDLRALGVYVEISSSSSTGAEELAIYRYMLNHAKDLGFTQNDIEKGFMITVEEDNPIIAMIAFIQFELNDMNAVVNLFDFNELLVRFSTSKAKEFLDD